MTKREIVVSNKGGAVIIGTNKGPVVSSSEDVVITRGKLLVDIVFDIDTTGSMDDEIEALKNTCVAFLDEPKKLGLEPTFGLVSFGDLSYQGGDRIETVVPLTADLEKMRQGIRNIPRNNGFGNDGESSLESLDEAMSLNFRPKAVKVIVLITDEPALENRQTARAMIQKLKDREFLVFVLGTSDWYYKAMAEENGGSWAEISSRSNLSALLELLRSLAKTVSKVSQNVHQIGGGSVKEYLRLQSPKK